MAAGRLRAVVATSSLDLGIDWGGVDQVIQVGAPKGVSRLLQRVGRANHRMDEASRAILVPANRFEVLECEAAHARASPRANWTATRRGPAGWTCWRSICWAWPAPRRSSRTMSSPRSPAPRPMPRSTRGDFDDVLRLRREWRLRAARLRPLSEAVPRRGGPGARAQRPHRPPAPDEHRHHRRGADDQGAPRPSARCWARSRNISSTCCAPATPSCSPAACCASCGCARWRPKSRRAATATPMVPAYEGGRHAADDQPRRPRARHAADPAQWPAFPEPVQEWLRCSDTARACPAEDDLLVETLSARRPLVSRRLLLRGPQRAPDAGHAADPPDGALRHRPARLCRHRLRAGRLVRPRAAQHGCPVRPGHAGRRPGSLDGGKLHAAPHLPQCRGDRRADRAAACRVPRATGGRSR